MGHYRKTVSAAFVFLVSAFYFIYALFCIESHSVRGVPDSAFIPKIVGCCMLLLSGVLLVSSIRSDRKGAESTSHEQASTEKKEFLNVMGTAAILLVYILLVEPIGFLPATTLYLFAQFLYLTPREKLRHAKTYVVYAVIALAVSASVYYLFLNAFHLILPAGILG